MFKWNEDKAIWFLDAENYTHFFEKLLDNIKGFISEDDSVLDVGCGLGILTSYMAFCSKYVTGLDIDDTAIEFAKKYHKKENLSYIQTSLEDFSKEKRKFDIVTACQFGSGDENYKRIMELADKRAIFVKNVNRSKTKVGRHRSTVFDLEKFLEKNGYKFKSFRYRYNFDQVLKDLDQAQKFIDFYGIKDAEIEKLDDEKFKYIIRKPKNIAIVVVEK